MNQLPKELTGFIFHFIKKQRVLFFILMICQLAWSLDQTLMPFVFKKFLDILIDFPGDRSLVWEKITFIISVGAFLWLLITFMFRGYEYFSIKTYPRFEANIRMAMIDYVQNHSIAYFAGNFSGSIANKINDMAKNASNIIDITLTCFIPTIIAMIIGILIFIGLHPLFGIVMLVWTIIHLAISLFFAKRCDDLSNTHSKSNSQLIGVIVDSISNIVAMKLFVRKNYELRYLQKFQDEEKANHKKIIFLLFEIRFIQAIVCFIIMGALNTYLMIVKWQNDTITASELVYIFYTSWGLTVMNWITTTQIPAFFRSIGICRQALELIKVEHDVKDKVGATEIIITNGKIQFKNVNFNYQRGTEVFSNKNITINPKEKVGLVGLSGSGKTTFVNLINRFYDVDSGTILIDDQDISKVTHDSLHSQITNIVQEPFLFHRSIFENIAYGKEGAGKEDVIKAAMKANCHDFISQMPEGYDTIVGQRGSKLSGGQRQRISIARAILKDAPILILDEATSALDSITEKYIQESLEILMQNRTCIIIAHRLSTLSSMDRILVFDQGKIIEDGTHQQLIDKKGYYYKIWSLQK